MSDELRALLIDEISKRLAVIEAAPADLDAALFNVVSLRGSAGLTGETNFASSLARLEPRLRNGDVGAIPIVISLLQRAVARLTEGEAAVGGSWPVPPADLEPRTIDAFVRASYEAEVADRLAGLDQALASGGDSVELVRVAFRHVHTLKGAASAVGDEPMSWFCHGLEERLRDVSDDATAKAALVELSQYRGILGGFASDPSGTLKRLRGEIEVRAQLSVPPPPPPSLATREATGSRTERAPPPEFEDETVRVDAAAVGRVLDGVETLFRFRERLDAHARRVRELARKARQARAGIGSDSTAGAHALAALADDLDLLAADVRATEGAFGADVIGAKRIASSLLLTSMATVFSRLAGVIETEGRRLDREVRTRVVGPEEPIDRRVAERLVEPCVQVVRNAVAHGIETPEVRVQSGKDPYGTITLSAKRVGPRLHVTISDDGAGVDLARVRAHAVTSGLMSEERAQAADDATLLALLLRPGFSTQPSADLLAGRGIGLDIAVHGIHKLGGSFKLMSRQGQGFSARIEVPVDAASSGVRIDRMTEDDLPAALEIVELTGTKDVETQKRTAAARLREELSRPFARLRVARGPSGDLLAMLVAWQVADEVHVLDVVTRVSARRRGIGRLLMNELLTFARGLPVRHLLLEVRRSNAPALHLYRSLGFYATNVRRRYYDDGEDAIEMRLELDDVTREVRWLPDEIVIDT